MTPPGGPQRALLGLACAAFVAIGLPVAALGVAWPTLRADAGRPLGDLGILSVLVTVGFALTALAHGSLMRRLSPGVALAGASALYAAGCAGFAVATWPSMVTGAVVLGAAALVTFLADRKSTRLNSSH